MLGNTFNRQNTYLFIFMATHTVVIRMPTQRKSSVGFPRFTNLPISFQVSVHVFRILLNQSDDEN